MRRRAVLQGQLRQGQIPASCTGCPIGHGIALNALLGNLPLR